jgi:mono/diheme cytochrome c family protein
MILAATGMAGVAITALFAWPMPQHDPGLVASLDGDPARGAYVARLGGCFACHTDTKGGGAMLAGGAGLKTPFGAFHAPNITMHETDGIGGWTLADFDRAMRNGTAPDGRPYYPAFPYAHYARMTDRDIADLWAAFRTVPPVPGAAPPHDLRFPFDRRILLRPWKTLFFDPEPHDDDPDRSTAWNRGRYLVEGPGHCTACHTPRNVLGALKTSQTLQGGIGLEGEEIPPLTPQSLERAGYDEENLAFALKTGVDPDGDALGGSMAEVVSGSTRFWTAKDRSAVAAYLLMTD